MKEKNEFEFGQLPVLEDHGRLLGESQSILRYIGKKYDYYPSDELEAWKVDSTLGSIKELSQEIAEAYGIDAREAHHWKVDINKEKWNNLMNVYIPEWLKKMDKRLVEFHGKDTTNLKFFVGDKCTIADFEMCALFYDFFLNKDFQDFIPFSALLSEH
jgi:glutathione S-transferase